MSQPPTKPPAPLSAEQARETIRKASQGDASVLPHLQRIFDEFPEMIGTFGDLVAHTQNALLELACGSDLAAREALARQQAALRERLREGSASPLEQLLVDRISLCFLDVHVAQLDLAQQRKKHGGAAPVLEAGERRLDHAQRRYLASIQKLATVRKLLRAAPSPVDLLRRPVREKGTASKQAEVRPRLAQAMASTRA